MKLLIMFTFEIKRSAFSLLNNVTVIKRFKFFKLQQIPGYLPFYSALACQRESGGSGSHWNFMKGFLRPFFCHKKPLQSMPWNLKIFVKGKRGMFFSTNVCLLQSRFAYSAASSCQPYFQCGGAMTVVTFIIGSELSGCGSYWFPGC